jgi:hypothetical protein
MIMQCLLFLSEINIFYCFTVTEGVPEMYLSFGNLGFSLKYSTVLTESAPSLTPVN